MLARGWRRGARLLLVFAAGSIGCGGSSSRLASARDVPAASSAPEIVAVRDLGEVGALPADGSALPVADTDGVFTVGELVQIEGRNLGKQPAVQIGGRPTPVVARSASGAILVRIPAGVAGAVGGGNGRAVEVEVSHRFGADRVSIEVTRFGFVVEPGGARLHVLRDDVGSEPRAAGSVAVEDVRAIAFAAGGRAAYALTAPAGNSGGRLVVLATATAGGPRAVRSLALEIEAPRFLVAATQAPLAAVVGARAALLVDTRDPLHPLVRSRVDLGAEGPGGPGFGGATLDARGRTLSLLAESGDRVIAIDVGDPKRPQVRDPVVARAGLGSPPLRTLTFSPDGDQLWGAASDAQGGSGALVALAVAHGAQTPLAVEPAAMLRTVGVPTLAVSARGNGIGPGTSIRSAARSALLVLAALSGDRASVLRSDLEGKTELLYGTPGAVIALGVNHDSSAVLAVVDRVRAGGRELGVAVVPLAGGRAHYLRLAPLSRAGGVLTGAGIALAP